MVIHKMFANFFKNTHDQRAVKIVDWAILRAKQTYPDRFKNQSETELQRIEKFEAITVFIAMALWYLNKSGSEYEELAADVYKTLFDKFDIAMREQGVSDVKMASKIRQLAEGFAERLSCYAKTFDNHDTATLASLLDDYGVCHGGSSLQGSISYISETKAMQDTTVENWLTQMEHPLPGKYEPHEINENY